MADKAARRSPTNLRFTLQIVITVVLLILSQHGDQVMSQLASTTEIKIRRQLKLIGECIDNTGAVRGHLDTWPTAVGECDSNTCFVAKSANFVIADTCPGIENEAVFDGGNCQLVGDSSQSFPDCCERLECSESPPLTTISPTVCIDRSPVQACEDWKELGEGCVANNTYFEEFLKENCRKSCGLKTQENFSMA